MTRPDAPLWADMQEFIAFLRHRLVLQPRRAISSSQLRLIIHAGDQITTTTIADSLPESVGRIAHAAKDKSSHREMSIL